ncbi:hypothetical protein ABH926_002458 [Catenulispora sp. GP43]|uniref:hypothetical protein n=1 Tax=Catenulispora sp. GP43 TaxID=3156263 RepID=UPI0035112BF2
MSITRPKHLASATSGLTAQEPRPTGHAPVLAGHVRSHWGIENKVHWARDVVFAEDAQHACLGATAQAMAVFRNLAVGIIRLSGTGQITRTVERIAAARTRILTLLAASR